MDKLKNFFNKENYTKIKLCLVAILALVASVIFEYAIYTRYIDQAYDSKTRMLIIAIIFGFVGLHFVIQINDLYEFIYKQRYKLAIRISHLCHVIQTIRLIHCQLQRPIPNEVRRQPISSLIRICQNGSNRRMGNIHHVHFVSRRRKRPISIL